LNGGQSGDHKDGNDYKCRSNNISDDAPIAIAMMRILSLLRVPIEKRVDDKREGETAAVTPPLRIAQIPHNEKVPLPLSKSNNRHHHHSREHTRQRY
jgi:hypothetical protein